MITSAIEPSHAEIFGVGLNFQSETPKEDISTGSIDQIGLIDGWTECRSEVTIHSSLLTFQLNLLFDAGMLRLLKPRCPISGVAIPDPAVRHDMI